MPFLAASVVTNLGRGYSFSQSTADLARSIFEVFNPVFWWCLAAFWFSSTSGLIGMTAHKRRSFAIFCASLAITGTTILADKHVDSLPFVAERMVNVLCIFGMVAAAGYCIWARLSKQPAS
jgi:hypothetical protein